MNSKEKIGELIRQQRKSIPLTLKQLAGMSGVSAAHLGRIELGQRRASADVFLKITKPLGLDVRELLILAGYPLPEPSGLPHKHTEKLRTELHTLVNRVIADSKRIKEIADLLLTGEHS
jgi:transcriptional regulator with XRE-family HTH domain